MDTHEHHYQLISHESIHTLLELLEHTSIRIYSTEGELSVTNLLDALDNEFLLGQLLGQHLSIQLDHQTFHYPVSDDQPEHSLATACIDILLKVKSSPLIPTIRALLANNLTTQPTGQYSLVL